MPFPPSPSKDKKNSFALCFAVHLHPVFIVTVHTRARPSELNYSQRFFIVFFMMLSGHLMMDSLSHRSSCRSCQPGVCFLFPSSLLRPCGSVPFRLRLCRLSLPALSQLACGISARGPCGANRAAGNGKTPSSARSPSARPSCGEGLVPRRFHCFSMEKWVPGLVGRLFSSESAAGSGGKSSSRNGEKMTCCK